MHIIIQSSRSEKIFSTPLNKPSLEENVNNVDISHFLSLEGNICLVNDKYFFMVEFGSNLVPIRTHYFEEITSKYQLNRFLFLYIRHVRINVHHSSVRIQGYSKQRFNWSIVCQQFWLG